MSGLGRGRNRGGRQFVPGGLALNGTVKPPQSTTNMTLDQRFSAMKQKGHQAQSPRRNVGSAKNQQFAREIAQRLDAQAYGGNDAFPGASAAKLDRARRIAQARAARDQLQGRFGTVANQIGFQGQGRGRGRQRGRGTRGRGRGGGIGRGGGEVGRGGGWGGSRRGTQSVSMRGQSRGPGRGGNLGRGRGGGMGSPQRGGFRGRGRGGFGARGRGGGRGRGGRGRGQFRGRGRGRGGGGGGDGNAVSREKLDEELDQYMQEGQQELDLD